jgi:phosphoribosylanthranilate isomerase
VFVNPHPEIIHPVFRDCHLDRVHFSGDEPPELLERFREWAYKALRPSSAAELSETVQRYPKHAIEPAWLIDAYRPGEYGGTGHKADWGLAASLAREAPVLLAGGLTAENVGEAIRQVHPWGVDVASGVESAPGVKDVRKMREFIRVVRSYQQEPIS